MAPVELLVTHAAFSGAARKKERSTARMRPSNRGGEDVDGTQFAQNAVRDRRKRSVATLLMGLNSAVLEMD